MKAKSIKGKSPEEIKKELASSMADGFKPSLAIVFSGPEQNIQKIGSIFGENKIEISGLTTAGEFINADYSHNSTAILLFETDPAGFRLYFEENAEIDTREKAQKLAQKALKQFKNPIFFVGGSGLKIDGEFIVRGIEDVAGKDTTIYGAMAGDNLEMKNTYVFTNRGSSNQGIVLLAFDGDKYEFKGRANSGITGIGTLKEITKAEGWWIHTIDNQPAIELIARYMGLKITQKTGIEPIPPEYTTTYPFIMHRKKGEPIVRPVFMMDYDNGYVMSNGMVEQGAKIQLTMPPDFEIIEKVIDDCKSVKDKELPNADAVIIFSCVGRLSALGPLINDELQGIQDTFNVPMAGLFSYGEFGRATNGNHEYHNLTCCWVAIKEK